MNKNEIKDIEDAVVKRANEDPVFKNLVLDVLNSKKRPLVESQRNVITKLS